MNSDPVQLWEIILFVVVWTVGPWMLYKAMERDHDRWFRDRQREGDD
jgi:hypothetical protein